MESKNIALIFAAIVALPLTANAASVTYDFTGTVTSANGSYGSLANGTLVTGTYTFDLANANSAQSTGTDIQAYGGSVVYGTPAPAGFVFLSTATVGAFSYVTGPVSPTFTTSQDIFNSYLQANEGSGANISKYTSSQLTLYPSGSNLPYTAEGLPVFLATPNDYGTFDTCANGCSSVRFSISSLTPVSPVPLPAAAWAMLSGLGGLAVFAKKKTRIGQFIPCRIDLRKNEE